MFHYPVLGGLIGVGGCKMGANRLQTRRTSPRWLQNGCKEVAKWVHFQCGRPRWVAKRCTGLALPILFGLAPSDPFYLRGEYANPTHGTGCFKTALRQPRIAPAMADAPPGAAVHQSWSAGPLPAGGRRSVALVSTNGWLRHPDESCNSTVVSITETV
jgi:hypothetical protein